MTPERWLSVKRLFHEALAHEPGHRSAFLDAACAGDTALRAELDALLSSQERAGDFMEVPAALPTVAQTRPPPLEGKRIGAYRVVRELGRGGMGTVYLAERDDGAFTRQVAIKLLGALSASDTHVDRFKRERQILAGLDHPNIARLLDGGTTDDGMPYLVMEYVDGEHIDRYCDARALPLAGRLALFRMVCAAVQFAHGKHVVHRDLKPGNVLVTGEGTPKLLDFGIAKLVDPAATARGPTSTAQMMTPAYASPEQVRNERVTAASDTYSLGVLLYRLLTGRGPYRVASDSVLELAQAIHEHAIEPPSAVAPQVPRDLESIVLRALRADPRERYASVADLSADVGRHLDGQPLSEETVTAQSRGTFRQRRWRTIGIAAVVAIAAAAGALLWTGRSGRLARAEPASIAVLPFADLSAARDQEFLSDGMTEEILDLLARVPGLRVAARTSAFAFKGKSEDVRAIGKKLNVGAVLEGSVRRMGDHVRVTAQLVDAKDGFDLWSQTYDRSLTDLFALQDEIGSTVVGALKLKLLAEAPARPAIDSGAYTQYLLGRQFFRRNDVEDFHRAVRAYEKAVALAPGYAPAWAGLAQATYWVADTAESIEAVDSGHARALAAAEKAVQLGPDLPDGFRIRGFIRVDVSRDWGGARRDIERALALCPDDPEALHFRGFMLQMVEGRDKEAIAAERKAVEIDPLNARAWTALGTILAFSGDRAGAREAYDRSLQISPSQSNTPYALGNVLILDGQPAAALEAYRRSTVEGLRLAGTAIVESERGHPEEADRIVADVATRFGHVIAYQLAQIHARRRDADRAFEWLERAFRQHDGGLNYLRRDPMLESLRGDARYVALLRKMNLPAD